MQTIYGLIVDCGDGSSTIRWFTNFELVERLLSEDEEYGMNEGCPAETFYFPENLNLEDCGFVFSDDEYLLDDEEN